MSPNDQVPDDSKCAVCGDKLSQDEMTDDQDDPVYNGFCGEQCQHVHETMVVLRNENAELRAKHQTFHRRVQHAEASIGPALEIMRGNWKGGSFGRALLAYGYGRAKEDIENLLAMIDERPEPDQLSIAGVETFAEHYREWDEKRRQLVLNITKQGMRSLREPSILIAACSRDAAQNMEHVHPHLIISITDPGSPWISKEPGGELVDVLHLEFHDFNEKHFRQADGTERTWNGLPIQQRAMQPSHASTVREFLENHHGKYRSIIVHCEAGVSRSPSMALAIAEVLGVPREQIEPVSRNHAVQPLNPWVYKLTKDELMKSTILRDYNPVAKAPELSAGSAPTEVTSDGHSRDDDSTCLERQGQAAEVSGEPEHSPTREIGSGPAR